MKKVTGHSMFVWLFASNLLQASEQQGVDWLTQETQTQPVSSIATEFQSYTERLMTLITLNESSAQHISIPELVDQSTESLSRLILLQQKKQLLDPISFSQLLQRQNSDGGFGHLEGWQSTILDTAIVLLLVDNLPPDVIKKAIQFIKNTQSINGGYYAAGYQDIELLYINAYVLLAINKLIATYPELTDNLKRHISFLEGKKLSNGQWSLDNQDLFIEALLNQALHNYRQNMESATVFSQKAIDLQLENGSWENDTYITSILLKSLFEQSKPRTSTDITPITSKISFSVIDTETGIAIPTVSVASIVNGKTTSTTSSPIGEVNISNLAEGAYQFIIEKAGYTPLTLDINVKQGQVVSLGQLKLSRATANGLMQIQGKVIDSATGVGIAGAVIKIVGTTKVAITGEDGSYQLGLEQEGDFTIEISKEGYAVQQGFATAEFGTTFNYSPKLIQEQAYIGTITGKVSSSTANLSGVQIIKDGVVIGTTNNSGDFTIQTSAGQQKITLKKANYIDLDVNIALPSGKTASLGNIKLQAIPVTSGGGTGSGTGGETPPPVVEYGQITLSAYDAVTGKMLISPIFKAEMLNDSGQVIQTQLFQAPVSDSVNVQQTVLQLAVGRWKISVTHPDYNNPPTGPANITKTITTQQAENASFTLKLAPYFLSGKVIDSITRNPLPDVTVRILSAETGAELYTLETNSQGVFDTYSAKSFSEHLLKVEVSPAAHLGATYYFEKKLTAQANNRADIGVISIRPISADRVLPDLRIESLDFALLNTDQQSLAISGVLKANIANKGNLAIPDTQEIRLSAFVDSNNNQLLDEDETVLGVSSWLNGLGSKTTQWLDIPIQGQTAFKDEPIRVWVDNPQRIAEKLETNNYRSTSDDRTIRPPESSLDYVTVWHYGKTAQKPMGDSTLFNSYVPIVAAPLTDTNGDGQIGKNDVAHVISITHNRVEAINAKTGQLAWRSPQLSVSGLYAPAIADIDKDGSPEILVSSSGGPNKEQLTILSANGQVKKNILRTDDASHMQHVEVADLDADGTPEILVGDAVISAQGYVVRNSPLWEVLAIADLNGDGKSEVIRKLGVETHSGEELFRFSSNDVFDTGRWPPSFAAVADVTGDGKPEIILTGKGVVALYSAQGQFLARYTITGGGNGGTPTIADFDGDGLADIGVAGARNYVVYRGDGSIIWSAQIQDTSSSYTGSTVFDFDGDGQQEVVYADEEYLWVFDAATGAVRIKELHSSGTAYERPIVLDADADNHADIIFISRGGGSRTHPDNVTYYGIRMLSSANKTWANTRNIWNQYSYHVTNVNDDLTIPQHEPKSWEVHNTYRANLLINESSTAAIDPSASYIRITDNGLTQPSVFTVRIGNAGGKTINTGLPVSFYRGNPAQGGVFIGTSLTSKVLNSGEYEDVTLSYNGTLANFGELYIVANDKGISTASTLEEYTGVNNIAHLPVQGGYQQLNLHSSLDKASYQSTESLSINSVINNLGSFDALADLRFSLIDSEGQIIGSLPFVPVSLAVQATLNHANTWAVNGLRKGDYTVKAELYRDNQRVAQQLLPFSVLSDAAATGLITPSLTSNKKSYSSADTVTLTQQLRNSSTNEVATNVQTTLVLQKADGTVIWQQSRDYGQIAPQVLREQSFQVPLLNADAGDYTVRLTVTADNLPTVTREAHFNVLPTAMTGVGLTGQLQGANTAVWTQQLDYTWQLENMGNSTVISLPVRLLVINPETEQIVTTINTSVDIEQNAKLAKQSGVIAPNITQPLLVLLQTQIGDDWKTLAQQPLTVSKPVLTTQITADKTQYGLNDSIVINEVIHNQSVVNLQQVKVTTLISQPNGQVVSESSQVLDITAQSQLPQTVNYTLNRAAAGQWQIITIIQDKNGIELNRQMSAFEVLSSALTGEGLTGHVLLAAQAVKGQDIAINWDLKNLGNAPLSDVETRIDFIDEQQQTIASLNNATVNVALDNVVDQQTPWTVVGNYNQVLQVRLSAKVGGQWKNIASTPIHVLAPQVNTTVESNKTSYRFNDLVEIQQYIKNESPVSLTNLNVTTLISRPDGVVVDTQQAIVNILAQNTIEQPVSYQFNKANAGQWTITSIVKDEQGIELTRQVKTVDVQSTAMTGDGLTGILQGASEAVWGQELNYTWQLDNQGNSDLMALPVRVVVMNPQTQQVVYAVNTRTDISKDNQVQQQSLVNLVDIKDSVQVLLQVQIGNDWKTLAQQPLTVSKPVVTTQITADKTQYGLNDSIVINEVIHNQSVVNLQQVKVTTLISQPNGQVVSESSQVLDINAQSQLPQTVNYTLNRAAAGQWQITTIIQEKTGIELHRQVSTFEVLSSTLTGEGLTGRLSLATQAVKGQEITLDWGLSNVGNSAYTDLATRIELLDEQQHVLATLSYPVTNLAVDTPLNQQTLWTVVGNYNQVLQARLSANVANQWKALANATIQVLAPQVTETLVTNKTSYGFNDKLDIKQQLRNDSPVVLNHIKVTTLISRPDGMVVDTQQTTLNLAAQSGVEQPVSYQFNKADAGQWTITSIVQDEQGIELTRQVKTVDVQSTAMTGEGISGTLSAAPVEVTVGQDVTLALALSNQGNAALTQQAITLTISKVGSNTPVKVITVTVDSLAKGSTVSKSANWTVTGQAGDVFSIVATTSFNGQVKTLASASFMAKAPQVAIELTPELAAQSRVLVYYSCGHDWYKGIKGWSFGDCHYSCFDQRSATLRAYLDSLKVNYSLVTKESDFVKAFRSGRYNQTWLLGAIEKLPKDMDEELHEAVHRGDALVTDGGVQTWYNHEIYDIVGVQYRGRLNFSNSEMSLTAPVFSQPQSIGKVKSAGWPLYLKPTTGTVTATYGANYCTSVNKDWIRDKEDEDKTFYGRHQTSYAAMVSNQYGYGKGLSMAFDLIASLDQPTEKTKWLSLLDQSLSWSNPTVNHRVDYVPQELVAVRSQLKNAGATAQTIRLQVTLPSGAVWMGTGTVDANRTVTQTITLAANSQQQVWLPILLPSLAGTHQLTIKTLSADGQQILSEKQQPFTVKSIDSRFAEVRIAFEQLAFNKQDDKLRDKAVDEIKDAQYLWSKGRYQEALSELGDASVYIREIEGRDVSKERLALDILMKGLSIQWFNNPR
ncbi:FG-GAP-like repeat-containing protein [Agitococcus lubricus]|uniref:Carboxypeptidase family protein n=1 Tax=Agitococcus lubricus TaxID=1077255 RepID=A0A2T5J244_9GAMM|nr:FG-GAP-like repeat-containing protein [Agitococcus lubricus]PTQ90505.1 carboxypeptidase family protein [Agitococcus lubricus]